MPCTISAVAVEADDVTAAEKLYAALGVADRVVVRPADAPAAGFHGYTLSIVTAQPATTPTPASPAPAAAGTNVVATPLSTYVTGDQRVRSSKLIGASVYNEQDEKIGSVDDVLITPGKEATGVVLSVGGFLGIASKLVEVPYSNISVRNDRLVMAGSTKDQLTKMPDYKYAAGL